MISNQDLKYVAHLARLYLSEQEVKHFTEQLEGILKYIDQLNGVDIAGVEPTTHVFSQRNIYREDQLKPSLPIEETLKNAPSQQNGFFKVPKVIE